MALLGPPLKDWVVYCEPMPATVYTLDRLSRVLAGAEALRADGDAAVSEHPGGQGQPRPGLVDAVLNGDLGDGHKPGDTGVVGVVMLLIDGGFDTTTERSAHSLEWLSENRRACAADPEIGHPAGPRVVDEQRLAEPVTVRKERTNLVG
jgi:cytochrome P450